MSPNLSSCCCINSHLVFLRPEVTEHRDDPSQQPRGGAQAQRDQHEEEEDGEELREEVKLGQGGWVAHKGQAGPRVDHLTDRNSQLVSQASEDGEDDEPREEGGEGVGEADDESILNVGHKVVLFLLGVQILTLYELCLKSLYEA